MDSRKRWCEFLIHDTSPSPITLIEARRIFLLSWARWLAVTRPSPIGTAVPQPRSVALHFSARQNSRDTVMRLSARNQVAGMIVDVTKGATTSHVRVDIG